MHDHFNEVGSVCKCGVPILKSKGFDGNGLCEYLLHPSYKPCLYSESRVISLALRVPLKIMSTFTDHENFRPMLSIELSFTKMNSKYIIKWSEFL